MKKFQILAVLVAVFAFSAIASAQDMDGKTLMDKSLKAYYYPGNDGKAEISMTITDKSGGTRKREMVMVRLNIGEAGGQQKFFIYFKEPGDVREMTFMVFKNPGNSDQRWLFNPSVKFITKISADDKRSSFVGSDFNYEDVSGRHINQDNHSKEADGEVNGVAAYVVKSTPNDNTEYAHKLTWIDKKNFINLKEEYYDASGKLLRTYLAEDIKDIDGLPTPMTRIMKNHESGGETTISIVKAEYNLKIKEKDFSERRMRRPPRNWIR
jgi:outer membrane lipoprotein-sorting protein